MPGWQGLLQGNAFLILHLPSAHRGHAEWKENFVWALEHGGSTGHEVGHLRGGLVMLIKDHEALA